MTENERFSVLSSYLGLYKIFDNENGEPLAYWEITKLMNDLVNENKKLKEELDEMINIFNDSGLDYHISDELEDFKCLE